MGEETTSEATRGPCGFCGRALTRTGMTRHLGACPARRKAVEEADAEAGEPEALVHLQVQDAWSGQYWLHLEVSGAAPLAEVDAYLRAIWLECCGHMSRFSTKVWGGSQVGMQRTVGQLFRPGTELTHTYDFGTSSVTVLRAMAIRTGRPITPYPVALLARNAPPEFVCQQCGKPATRLCLECVNDRDEQHPGTLCARHAARHPHDDYGEPMPLVNSPRIGLCGYDGPAEPPY